MLLSAINKLFFSQELTNVQLRGLRHDVEERGSACLPVRGARCRAMVLLPRVEPPAQSYASCLQHMLALCSYERFLVHASLTTTGSALSQATENPEAF